MSQTDTLETLTREASYDTCGGCDGFDASEWIFNATGRGRRVPLLKVLLTSECARNCNYCGLRADRDASRHTVTPDDLARQFDRLHAAGAVEGLFLSSGLFGPARSVGQAMLDTAAIVRERYGFTGYVHLKIMPGADADYVRRALALADRVSINVEAPNEPRLALLAPGKRLAPALGIMRAVREEIRALEERGRHATQTTQFVVGAAGESDAELLGAAQRTYRELSIARNYYSPFRPIEGTPLEALAPCNPTRQARLYQADFLIRDYGFSARELVTDDAGNLPLGIDPKRAYATLHPELFPVEVNRAERAELLRVPGIGPTAAGRILRRRARERICDARVFKALVARHRVAAPYVLLDGKPTTGRGPTLFDAPRS